MKIELIASLSVGDSVLLEVPRGRTVQRVMRCCTDIASRLGYTLQTVTLTATNYQFGLVILVVRVVRID